MLFIACPSYTKGKQQEKSPIPGYGDKEVKQLVRKTPLAKIAPGQRLIIMDR